MAWWVVAGLWGLTGPNGGGQVGLELRIPPAETYVIGDAIPLFWRFGNQSTQALGFMWEGCCRLNGKLEITSVDASTALPMLPTGQALAHMFAKADRLEPGVPKEYDTKVSDWVVLPGTGRYRLQGTYRGVLPSQFPQVSRGLALWRESAVSDPIELAVISVDDYLGQRDARVERRGLQVTLSGPESLPPLAPVTFRLTLENVGRREETVRWPDQMELWVLDDRHRRVAPAVVIGDVPSVPVTLASGGRWTGEFILTSDRFEGEPLGDYEMFVDLAGDGSDRPRVPSNRSKLAWRLDTRRIVELLSAAAGGARTGARNAPLKLLRVYLAEVGASLTPEVMAALPPEARALGGRLSQAARLRSLSPKPGTVELGLRVPGEGPPRWIDEGVNEVVSRVGPEVAAQLGEVLAVRRHLGWEVGVAVWPEPEVSVERLAAVQASLDSHRTELVRVPEWLIPTGGTNAPARLRWVAGEGAVRSGPVLKITSDGRRFWAPDGKGFSAVGDDAALAAGLSTLGAGQTVRIEVPPDLSWRRLTSGLGPLNRPGAIHVLELATADR